MNGTKHLTIGLSVSAIMYISIYFTFGWSDIFSAIFFGIIGSIFPDLDLAILPYGSHRHWFFHSVFVPASCFVYAIVLEMSRFYDLMYFCAAISLHLIADLHLSKEKKKGTYLILQWKGHRMSVKGTDAWMCINICAAIVLSVLSFIMINTGLAG